MNLTDIIKLTADRQTSAQIVLRRARLARGSDGVAIQWPRWRCLCPHPYSSPVRSRHSTHALILGARRVSPILLPPHRHTEAGESLATFPVREGRYRAGWGSLLRCSSKGST